MVVKAKAKKILAKIGVQMAILASLTLLTAGVVGIEGVFATGAEAAESSGVERGVVETERGIPQGGVGGDKRSFRISEDGEGSLPKRNRSITDDRGVGVRPREGGGGGGGGGMEVGVRPRERSGGGVFSRDWITHPTMDRRPFFEDYDPGLSMYGEEFHERFVQDPQNWTHSEHYFRMGELSRLPNPDDRERLQFLQNTFHELTPSLKGVKLEVRRVYYRHGEASYGFFDSKLNRIIIDDKFKSGTNPDAMTVDDLAIHEWCHALVQFSEEEEHGKFFSEAHHQLYQQLFDKGVLSSSDIAKASKRWSNFTTSLVGVMSQEELQGHELLLAKIGVSPGFW